MTTDQEAEDVAASVRHRLVQRGKDAENWRRQANDWEARCKELRTQVDDLTEVLRGRTAEIEEARAILGAIDNETLVEAARDLVREYETTNEAYHNIHARYWKEAIPRIGAFESAIDQAISNLRGMKALNDDPIIEEMIDATADLLGARVSSPDAEQV